MDGMPQAPPRNSWRGSEGERADQPQPLVRSSARTEDSRGPLCVHSLREAAYTQQGPGGPQPCLIPSPALALRALLRLDWPRRAPAHRRRGTWPLGRITRSTSLLRDSWCLQALRGMAAPGGHSPGGSSDGHRGRPGRGLSAVQSDAPLQGSGCPSPCHPCGVLGFLLPLSGGAGTVLEASWPGVAPGVSLTACSHHVSIFHFYEHLFVL